jgi:uncharacterized membrane protein (UPF0136 family)
MHGTAIMVWMYGVLMAVGGVVGYVKVRSKASLLSGVGFGLMLLASGLGVWRGARQSLMAAAVIAALLVAIFAVRLVKTRRFMPAGALAILSVAALVVFGMALTR